MLHFEDGLVILTNTKDSELLYYTRCDHLTNIDKGRASAMSMA